MINEILIMVVMYHLLIFTPFVPDIETQFLMGYVVCCAVGAHLLINIGIMIKMGSADIIKKFKIWFQKRSLGA